MKISFLSLLVITALIVFSPCALCESGDPLVLTKEITGTITFINESLVGITYKKDPDRKISFDLVCSIDSRVNVGEKRSLAEFREGDTVQIEYTEATGPEGVVRVAKKILLLRSGTPSLDVKGFKR